MWHVWMRIPLNTRSKCSLVIVILNIILSVWLIFFFFLHFVLFLVAQQSSAEAATAARCEIQIEKKTRPRKRHILLYVSLYIVSIDYYQSCGVFFFLFLYPSNRILFIRKPSLILYIYIHRAPWEREGKCQFECDKTTTTVFVYAQYEKKETILYSNNR